MGPTTIRQARAGRDQRRGRVIAVWRHVVEEIRRGTEVKVASARAEGQENAGKCGKTLHKFKGHEDGKLEGASRKEGKEEKSMVKLES